MRKFKDLTIWNIGMILTKEIYKVCHLLPDIEKYGLVSQMQRAAVSIPSNIAEGCSRKSDIEFARYLEISLGSAFELETQLILVEELGLIKKNADLGSIFISLEKVQKMINSFKSKVAKPNPQKPNNLIA